MKYLLLLLLPVVALGVEPEFDLNKMLGIIESLTSGGIIAIIGGSMGVLLTLVSWLVFLFNARNKREQEAHDYAIKIRNEQTANLARLQRDLSIGTISTLEAAYKLDLDFFTKCITDKEYPKVYLKLPQQYHTEISEFLYKEDLEPNIRAGLIIKRIKQK